MNLSTVKWAQRDKTQYRELLRLFICVCIALCTLLRTILHRTDLIIFLLTLQTITIAPTMSITQSHELGKWQMQLITCAGGRRPIKVKHWSYSIIGSGSRFTMNSNPN